MCLLREDTFWIITSNRLSSLLIWDLVGFKFIEIVSRECKRFSILFNLSKISVSLLAFFIFGFFIALLAFPLHDLT